MPSLHLVSVFNYQYIHLLLYLSGCVYYYYYYYYALQHRWWKQEVMNDKKKRSEKIKCHKSSYIRPSSHEGEGVASLPQQGGEAG